MTNSFNRIFLFDDKRKKKLLTLRDKLDYLPNGIQAQIAKDVGCTRQTVHNVLYAYNDDIAVRSDFAYNVWKALEGIMAQKDNMEEYDVMHSIVDGLRKGSNIKIEMALTKFRLIKRKLDKSGVPYKMEKSRGWPNSYLLTPKNPTLSA